jgi:hypothetical protein
MAMLCDAQSFSSARVVPESSQPQRFFGTSGFRGGPEGLQLRRQVLHDALEILAETS